MRILHSTGGDRASDASVADAYARTLGGRAGRPWVALCMIASLDGSTVVDGRSGPLGNDTDAAVLRRLRTVCDVVIVGARTAEHESYGPPAKSGQRIGVVTASGRVDLGRPLFTSGAGFVITTDDSPLSAAPHGVDVVTAGRGSVDLQAALAGIDDVCGAPDTVLAEGGSTLNGALLQADLVDELDITTSARAAGGTGPRLAVGHDHEQRGFTLVQAAIDDESFLYTRWRRQGR